MKISILENNMKFIKNRPLYFTSELRACVTIQKNRDTIKKSLMKLANI